MSNGLARTIVAFLVMCSLAGLAAYAWEWHRAHPRDLRSVVRDKWRALRTRWSPPAYLTVHFLIGLGVSLAALALLSLITVGVVRKQRVTVFDQGLADLIERHSTETGVMLANLTSALVDPRLMFVLMIIGATLLWLRHRSVVLAGWITAFLGAAVLDGALRIVFRPDRPAWTESLVNVGGFSFPSGHAVGALVGWGMVAYLVLTFMPRRRWSDAGIGLALATLLLFIGFSRIYLGVHFVSDVIAGFAAGIIWVATCVTAIEVAKGERDRRERERREGSRADADSDRRRAERRVAV